MRGNAVGEEHFSTSPELQDETRDCA